MAWDAGKGAPFIDPPNRFAPCARAPCDNAITMYRRNLCASPTRAHARETLFTNQDMHRTANQRALSVFHSILGKLPDTGHRATRRTLKRPPSLERRTLAVDGVSVWYPRDRPVTSCACAPRACDPPRRCCVVLTIGSQAVDRSQIPAYAAIPERVSRLSDMALIARVRLLPCDVMSLYAGSRNDLD